MEKPIVLLSGGFDPYHDGHAKMFQKAAEIGDICVILNSDDWLVAKKGKAFMSLLQRADILSSVKGVEWVWHSETLSDVSKDIEDIYNHLLYKNRFLIFANGGDRTARNTPEQAICEKLGIPVIFGLGGEKSNSSSALLEQWNVSSNLSKSTIEVMDSWYHDSMA
jgi:cytidyltransferase-like protein